LLCLNRGERFGRLLLRLLECGSMCRVGGGGEGLDGRGSLFLELLRLRLLRLLRLFQLSLMLLLLLVERRLGGRRGRRLVLLRGLLEGGRDRRCCLLLRGR
jgi:hypothetical protein